MNIKYDRNMLESAVKDCTSFSGVVRKLGLTLSGGNQTKIKDLIKYFDIDTSHFKGHAWNKGLTAKTSSSVGKYSTALTKYTDDEILSYNDKPLTNKKRLRELVKSKKKYCCELCGLVDEWNNLPLTLHLDHVNGNRLDNRIENLRWLCPNCHQQTPTWGAKNSKLELSGYSLK